MTSGRRYTVSGRVQGVWFRESTRRVAEQVGIVGRAINLANGDVEVVCFGDTASLDELEAWLGKGPPLARVTKVVSESVDDETPPASFTTG